MGCKKIFFFENQGEKFNRQKFGYCVELSSVGNFSKEPV